VPAGDYYVQAMLEPYTKFSRADGHVIWVHNDQWEGQRFNISPGNLVSEVERVHWDPHGRRCVAAVASGRGGIPTPGAVANVGRRDCTEVDFSLKVDGKLAGRVTTEDGKPARFVKVAIIPISPVHPQLTADTDEDGHFEVGSRQADQYIVGVGILAPFASAEWKSRVYYPGVPAREQAKVIEIATVNGALTLTSSSCRVPRLRDRCNQAWLLKKAISRKNRQNRGIENV
jgi:hypothetical protein